MMFGMGTESMASEDRVRAIVRAVVLSKLENESIKQIHVTPEEALQEHLDIKGKYLIPLHFGTFDLALHPWYEPIERLVTFSEKESITLITPEIGEKINFQDMQNTDYWWLKYKTNNTQIY